MANWLCLIQFSAFEVMHPDVHAHAFILKTIAQTNILLWIKDTCKYYIKYAECHKK